MLVDVLRLDPPYLPAEWIRAIANLRDPATYDALLRYLVRGNSPRSTYDAIRELPGIELEEAVAEL